MRDIFGFITLFGAVFCGVLGWSLLDQDGYLKLFGVLMLLCSPGLLLVSMGALRDSRRQGLARGANGLFWVVVGLLLLMSLSERFGNG